MANIFEFNGYKPVIDKSAFVHPNATVTGNVIIGKNVYIGPGAAIRGTRWHSPRVGALNS